MWPVIVVSAASRWPRTIAPCWSILDKPLPSARPSEYPARLRRYLWLMVITTFVVWLPFGIFYGTYMTFVFLYARPRGIFVQGAAPRDPQAVVLFGLVSLVFALLALASVVYAVMMGLRYSLAVPACVIEDIKARRPCAAASSSARDRAAASSCLRFLWSPSRSVLD